jgi:DNA polymerase III epsilon subunit-like protein
MAKKGAPFKLVLGIDCETTGIAYGCDDPSYNPVTGEKFQAVSWGLVVATADTLKVVEELYIEVQWDGVSKWEPAAERVHGLSKQYLAENGSTPEEAVALMANLILDYWGPDGVVCMLGHNVSTFDRFFFKRAMREFGLEIKLGSRCIDTFSLGFGTFGTQDSNELFEAVGLPERDPNKHNALVDAKNAVESVRIIKTIFNNVVG